jgi:bifunctional UDP-N-acetylglucosamine pyrophosphorylase/glucosamine-1-phosphate N-acetyltransferase
VSDFDVIVLAAGIGKRMKSAVPKVLHPAAGRPLVYYPAKAARDAGAGRLAVVVSPAASQGVVDCFGACFGPDWGSVVVQDPPRGTGDAARIGLESTSAERVLILCGDTPLIDAAALMALVAAFDASAGVGLAFASSLPDDPGGYGRVLRDSFGRVSEIREHRDLATDAEIAVREVNAGVYLADRAALAGALGRIQPNNAQGEYYLTDVVALLARDQAVIAVPGGTDVLVGVNDRSQLCAAEALLYQRIARSHALAGVTLHGPSFIDEGVRIDVDAVIHAGVSLRGATSIGPGTVVDVGSVITDSTLGAGVMVKPYSVITDSRVGDDAQIGPFAHLRPGSQIDEEAHIGNFVETKKTRVRRGAKANHLSYLGDGDVGERANIGAGTIFCNYDGFKKHQTTIGAGAFIGSDSQLIAPVTIGEGAYVATGTSVNRDVPADALAIGRVRQENKPGYASKLKARLKAASGK